MKKNKIQIKKYGNRRLYDMTQKRYITLEDLAMLIQDGNEVEITDSKTGEDLTQLVLTQLILENHKSGLHYLFTSEVLHQLIQYQDQSVADFFQSYLPRILTSYIDWQKQAQDHFMNWANLGWTANQYSRDLMTPQFNWWGPPPEGPSRPEPQKAQPEVESGQAEAEIEALRAKIDALEKRLNKPRKR